MRPTRFQDLLLDVAKNTAGITAARTFADAGHTAHPYGVITQLDGGGSVWWQVIGASAPGDRYADPEPAPVTGDRPAPIDAPALRTGSKGVQLSDLEQVLAAGLLAADTAGEISGARTYSDSAQPPAVRYGMTLDFHDESRIFVNALATLRQGENDPSRRLFMADATV